MALLMGKGQSYLRMIVVYCIRQDDATVRQLEGTLTILEGMRAISTRFFSCNDVGVKFKSQIFGGDEIPSAPCGDAHMYTHYAAYDMHYT